MTKRFKDFLLEAEGKGLTAQQVSKAIRDAGFKPRVGQGASRGPVSYEFDAGKGKLAEVWFEVGKPSGEVELDGELLQRFEDLRQLGAILRVLVPKDWGNESIDDDDDEDALFDQHDTAIGRADALIKKLKAGKGRTAARVKMVNDLKAAYLDAVAATEKLGNKKLTKKYTDAANQAAKKWLA